MGADGKHLRFVGALVRRHLPRRAAGAPARDAERARRRPLRRRRRVERNDWNGTSSRAAREPRRRAGHRPGQRRRRACARRCATRRARSARCRRRSTTPLRRRCSPGRVARAATPPRRAGALAELVRIAATGEGVLVVVADVARRRGLLRHALHPARFGLAGALLFSRRCSGGGARRAPGAGGRRRLAGAGRPRHAGPPPRARRGFRHVAVLDPPASARGAAGARRAAGGRRRARAGRAAGGGAGAPRCTRPAPRARSPRRSGARSAGGGGTADALHERLLATADAPDAAECAWALDVLVEAGPGARATARRTSRSAGAPGRVDLATRPGVRRGGRGARRRPARARRRAAAGRGVGYQLGDSANSSSRRRPRCQATSSRGGRGAPSRLGAEVAATGRRIRRTGKASRRRPSTDAQRVVRVQRRRTRGATSSCVDALRAGARASASTGAVATKLSAGRLGRRRHHGSPCAPSSRCGGRGQREATAALRDQALDVGAGTCRARARRCRGRS